LASGIETGKKGELQKIIEIPNEIYQKVLTTEARISSIHAGKTHLKSIKNQPITGI
jgi:hypothetical protein